MTLFDAAEYGEPRRARRASDKTLSDVAILVTERWRGIARRQPSIVHAIHTAHPTGPVMSWCGEMVIPHTYNNGETVAGCGACIAAGAPVRRA